MLRPFVMTYVTWFKLLRDSWHSAVVSVAAQSLNVAAVALAGRALGASAYGTVLAVAAYYGWFCLLASFPTYALLPRFLADRRLSHEDKAGACASAFCITASLTGLGVLFALVLLPLFLRRFGIEELPGASALYAVIFALSQLRSTVDYTCQAAGWLPQWSASNLVATVLPVALLLAYVAGLGSMTPFGYVLLLVIAAVVSFGFTLFLFMRALGGWRALSPDVTMIGPILAAGRGPWIAVASNVLAEYGRQSFIAAYLVSADLGQYGVVCALSSWVTGIGLAVRVPAMSDWSRIAAARHLAILRKDLRRRQAATAVVLATVAVLVLFSAEPILRLIYGPDYVPAAAALRLFTVEWVLCGLGGWYWIMIYAIGHPWRIAVPNLAYSLPTFVLTYLLIRFTPLGILGAVLASVIGHLGWLVSHEWNFRAALRHETRLLSVPSP